LFGKGEEKQGNNYVVLLTEVNLRLGIMGSTMAMGTLWRRGDIKREEIFKNFKADIHINLY
jgi:hypothetical protein